MDKRNTVYIATSIDGFIADRNGGLDWLQSVPNPDQLDLGFAAFIESIDAIVMGRNTFDVVCSFDIDWPYTKPVFVLSRTLEAIPEKYITYAELVSGKPKDVLSIINNKGYNKLYIDGGATIQGFLEEDLIDDLIISKIPILLGGGAKLFSELPKEISFEHIETKVLLGHIVQSHYSRVH